MKLHNDFTDEQKILWSDVWWCHAPGKRNGFCESNEGVSLHHICGRKGKYNKSTLNGIPLCLKHHEQYTFLDKGELLKITIKFLMSIFYKLTEEDVLFYKEHIMYYDA
ncbi:MAG: hypothetical protein PHS93_09060 [Candidatus Omnitrophica bacterium]|nr:hypothetical protein [Candidatus Omnitrophota bacterium]MDD5551286.1 hypothetical protein [Candidatus Omnitrophota bacterium]